MSLTRRWLLFLLLDLSLALAACGFQLRGSGAQANLPFHSIYLGAAENTPLGTELKRYLRAGGTQVGQDKAAAEASIEVLSESRQKSVLSLNTQGRVREFSLVYRVSFQVRDKAGALLLAPTEIALKRDISFNESQAIAKEKEEEMLYRDMQGDLVQQILRRLAALRPA